MISKQIARKIGFCSMPALLAGVTLLAQSPSGGGGQQPSMPQQPPSSTMPSPNTGAGPGTNPSNPNFADQAFVSKAMEGGKAEVQLGQIAQEKSQSNDVKQYAQKMVNEHLQMEDKWFKPVAQQIGVSEPKGPSKKDKKEIAKMQTLSGQQFDTEYIQDMVKNHKADLKDYQNEAQSATDPNVKQVAQQGSRIIQQDLQLAEQLAQNHNVPIEEKGKEVSNTSSNR